jgi:MarR family transcriptional regulator for hemolysin
MEKLDEILFYTLEKSMKVYRKFAQSQIRAKGFDITIDQWLILKTLEENKQLSQNQIAELVFKDVASLTRILELLVRKKYVKRKISGTDRRKFDLEITAAGNSIISSIYPLVIENRKQALKKIDKADLLVLKCQLEKIINNCK